ncbi:MAG: hypothetical protein H6667_17745 [Ardenticatenaceae bacterium]|nr:hypothetical protein [Ardenticatenaceae bacterium]
MLDVWWLLPTGDGGMIVLGLEEKGQLTESIWEEEVEGAARGGLQSPAIPAAGSRWKTGRDTLVGINVPRSQELHTMYDGRVLIRSGNWNRR